MTPSRFSIRALIIAVAIIGFDVAVMTQAVRQGRHAHAVSEYATGFGLVLLILNLLVLGLVFYCARRANLPVATRLNSTPSPLVIFGLYAAVLSIAILSVLFFTSGRF